MYNIIVCYNDEDVYIYHISVYVNVIIVNISTIWKSMLYSNIIIYIVYITN